MPLGWPPPAVGSLADTASLRFPDIVYRVHRATRAPWWFASVGVTDDPNQCGRYDLSPPNGTMYFADEPVVATLEALQDHLGCLVVDELLIRRRAAVTVPTTIDAADLTDPQLTSAGVTNAVWSGDDRPRSQAWAAGFFRDGWAAVASPCQHDLAQAGRTFALFGGAGEHTPAIGGTPWVHTSHTLHDDQDLLDQLDAYGVRVLDPGNLRIVDP